MNTEEDNDPQEVFVVGDYAEYNVEPNCNIPADSSGFNAAFVFSIFLFAPMAMVAFFASIISKSCNISFGEIGVPLLVVTAMILFLLLLISSRTEGGVSTQNSKQHQPRSRRMRKPSRRSRSSKKFNNIDEYEKSPEFAEDEAEKKAQAYNDDIELAVDALMRLGYGGKGKCQDWVERGIKSGILSNQTDRLVKYALTRGAVS